MSWDSVWRRRRLPRRRFVSGAGFTAAGLVLAGCSGTAGTTLEPTPAPVVTANIATPVARPTEAPRTAKYGGIFKMTIGSTEQPNLDPHQNNSTALVSYGAGMAWSQLLQFKNGPGVPMPNFEVVGDLAESWTQPDDVTYVFKLRQGVKFHNIPPVNGRELTAEDIKFSYERQVAEKINAGFLAGIIKMDVVDKYTFRIQLDSPNADILWSLGSNFCKIIPRETVEATGDLKEGPVIGTGPWIFDRWEKNQVMQLKRNPDYFIKGRPYLDGLHWYRIGDQQTLLNAFRSQNLDVLQTGITKADADELKRQNPTLNVRTGPGPSRFEIFVKGDRPPFNDRRLREALSKAINRQELIDTIFGGVGIVDSGVTLASDAAALPAAELKQLLGYDLEGARRLMREAGVDRIDVEMQVGDFLSGLLVQYAELMQAQLAKANINLKLNVVQGTAWVTQVRVQGQYHVAFGLQSGAAPTSTELRNRHHSKGIQNTTMINDPELDKLIDQQAVMVRDPAGRNKLIQEIQRRFISLYGYIPLATQGAIYVEWPYVKDWNNNQSVNNTNGDTIHVWLDK